VAGHVHTGLPLLWGQFGGELSLFALFLTASVLLIQPPANRTKGAVIMIAETAGRIGHRANTSVITRPARRLTVEATIQL